MLPVEFIVFGSPASLQSKGKKRLGWRARVSAAAREAWGPGPPVPGPVVLSVTNVFVSKAPDVDNVIKPVQDALENIVYLTDAQVTLVLSKKIQVSATLPVEDLGPEGVAAFDSRGNFVHIKITSANDPHIGFT